MLKILNVAPLLLNILFLNLVFSTAWSITTNSQVIKENSASILYKVPGIPYSIKSIKKESCDFTDREIELLIETFQALPEIYASMGNQFHFEKKCLIDPKIENDTFENLDDPSFEVAQDVFKAIVLTDRVFSYMQDGKLKQMKENFSKKMITHELTHQLDKKYNYSGSDQFRNINGWKRKFGFISYEKETAEGFHREQGSDNPKEDLATQAEGFFFKADYICKHPQSYVWFYYWIGQPAVPTVASCPSEMNTPIDPAKVKDVGYIFISSTDEYAESIFGHSLIRLHMDQPDPFEDFAIEAAGNISNMPALTGFETPEEMEQKQTQAEQMKVSRLGFVLKGASGLLELKVQRLSYRMKWNETTVLHGRDISERILALTQLQKRVLVYMLNKDINNTSNGNYNILTKNCASYIAQVINKAIGDDVAEKNKLGVYTPRNVYKSFSPIVGQDLPVMEGAKSRLARLLPRRKKIIQILRNQPLFSSVNFDALEDPTENIKETVTTLENIVSITKSNRTQISNELKSDLKTFIYTYGAEGNLYLRRNATDLYGRIFVALKPK